MGNGQNDDGSRRKVARAPSTVNAALAADHNFWVSERDRL
jgi:hypothetical protein